MPIGSPYRDSNDKQFVEARDRRVFFGTRAQHPRCEKHIGMHKSMGSRGPLHN